MSLTVHDDAEEELNEAAEYYQAQQTGLGREFLDTLYSGFQTIIASPESWPPVRGRFRRYLLDRFPFSIIYSVESDTIFVVAVAHHARRPGYWRLRARH